MALSPPSSSGNRAPRPLERLWQFTDPGKEIAREMTRISHVLVAAEFDNERNLIDIRQQRGIRRPYVRRTLVETGLNRFHRPDTVILSEAKACPELAEGDLLFPQ